MNKVVPYALSLSLAAAPATAEIVGGPFNVLNEEIRVNVVRELTGTIAEAVPNVNRAVLEDSLHVNTIPLYTAVMNKPHLRDIIWTVDSTRADNDLTLKISINSDVNDTLMAERTFIVPTSQPDTVTVAQSNPWYTPTALQAGIGYNGRNTVAEAGLTLGERVVLTSSYGIPDSRNPAPRGPVYGTPDPFIGTKTSTVIDTTHDQRVAKTLELGYLTQIHNWRLTPSLGIQWNRRKTNGNADTKEVDANGSPLTDGYQRIRPFSTRDRSRDGVLSIAAEHDIQGRYGLAGKFSITTGKDVRGTAYIRKAF